MLSLALCLMHSLSLYTFPSSLSLPDHLPGADINVVDDVKGKSITDWALKTSRFEVLQRLRRLQACPIAEQFCDSYVMEWPELKELVAKGLRDENLEGCWFKSLLQLGKICWGGMQA